MLGSQLEINMDSIRTLHPLTRAWLLDGPLSAHLGAYLTLLERGRYAEGSIEKHLRALPHFAHWMTRCRLAAGQLDEGFVGQSLNHHPVLHGRSRADHPGDYEHERTVGSPGIRFRAQCRRTQLCLGWQR